jgi:hypothetical protein
MTNTESIKRHITASDIRELLNEHFEDYHVKWSIIDNGHDARVHCDVVHLIRYSNYDKCDWQVVYHVRRFYVQVTWTNGQWLCRVYDRTKKHKRIADFTAADDIVILGRYIRNMLSIISERINHYYDKMV